MERGSIGNESISWKVYFGRGGVYFVYFSLTVPSLFLSKSCFFLEEGKEIIFPPPPFLHLVPFPCPSSNPIMLISNFHPFDSA